ncbi:hypothetical protein [Ammoniphilus resinae]|uniref:hypothetical protein n=1 Tax=Ammoniphilus resinae TaxID=861532 RepID=UPI001AEA91E8|nr:hypothetical protein [Ammoniphilus resinae]
MLHHIRKPSTIEARLKKLYSSLEGAFPLRGQQSLLSKKENRRSSEGIRCCHADRQAMWKKTDQAFDGGTKI